MFRGEFVSSASKLAAAFRISRDTWKNRAQEQQKRVKALDGKVRDLTVSRDHWKQEVKDLREQLKNMTAGPAAQNESASAVGKEGVIACNGGDPNLGSRPFEKTEDASAAKFRVDQSRTNDVEGGAVGTVVGELVVGESPGGAMGRRQAEGAPFFFQCRSDMVSRST